MIQELLPLLGSPPADLQLFVEIAAVVSVVGLGLWLTGARFSRQIVALLGVAAGAITGKFIPQVVPSIGIMSAPALAILGALIGGGLAFLTHRLWIGVMFAWLLAGWAAIGTWAAKHGQQTWSPPVWDADMNYIRFALGVWSGLPADVTRILPYVVGCAMLSGIAVSVLWPRLTTALNWSLAGLSLALCTGLAAITFGRPEWLNHVPPQMSMQIAVFTGLVLFGALVQWQLTPRGAVKVKMNAQVKE